MRDTDVAVYPPSPLETLASYHDSHSDTGDVSGSCHNYLSIRRPCLGYDGSCLIATADVDNVVFGGGD